MASTIFPVATSSSPGLLTVTANLALNSVVTPLPAGVYKIDCTPTSSVLNVEFYTDATTLLTTAITSSGTITVNIASACDRVRLWLTTGSNTQVTIDRIADSFTNVASGTLDTITASTTYTNTSVSGLAYAALVGGGGGGGGVGSVVNGGGGGGASGAVVYKLVTLTGSMPIVIGTAGAGGATGANNGTAGGDTTFAGLTANGGGGGTASVTGTPAGAGGSGVTPTGGTYNSTGSSGGAAGAVGGTATVNRYPFVNNGTTGGGAGGRNAGGGQLGSGSGIGTGGTGGSNSNGSAATGYGAGGGGGGTDNNANQRAGAAGTAGVVYILRF